MICLLCQWITVRRLDDGLEPPRWTARHVQRCPECRGQQHRHRAIVERLSASAGASRAQPPPFLRARILANLNAAPAEISNPPGRWFEFAAGALTLALLALLLWPRGTEPSDAAPLARRAGSPGRVALAALPSLPAQDAVLALGTNLEEPLASELRLVMDDAKTAMAALSRNFLPTDRTQPRR